MPQSSKRLDPPTTMRGLVPADLVDECGTSISLAEQWCSRLPKESCFYLNGKVPLRNPPPGNRYISRRDLNLADAIFDVHSLLTGLLLTKSWRVGQLAAGLRVSFETWNLTVCATIVRALVESASSWWIESSEIITAWWEQKARDVFSVQDALMQQPGD